MPPLRKEEYGLSDSVRVARVICEPLNSSKDFVLRDY